MAGRKLKWINIGKDLYNITLKGHTVKNINAPNPFEATKIATKILLAEGKIK